MAKKLFFKENRTHITQMQRTCRSDNPDSYLDREAGLSNPCYQCAIKIL
jgi:hypothetical protein